MFLLIGHIRRRRALNFNEKLANIKQQALRNSCELLRQRKELHTNSWNCMQDQGTACKIMDLQVSSFNWIQAYVTALKLMELHASLATLG